MNWQAIGAVGEIGGAIGVVLTLIYLAGQLRQNTNALRSASYEHWNSVSTAFSEMFAKYRVELSEIEQHTGLSDLSPEQLKMLQALGILATNQAQTASLEWSHSHWQQHRQYIVLPLAIQSEIKQ